jgi:malate dehydrogenase (oxaloacetate-decarboxylating)
MSNATPVVREALDFRHRHRGLIGIDSKVPVKDGAALSRVYTPGVAEPCLRIAAEPTISFEVTCRGNTVALATDGSGLFRLGRAGAEAALPVMEGKSVIFKTFAGIDALPICLNTRDAVEFIDTVIALMPTFGAICLEDIASPQSFTITAHLKRAMNIPVFNNHGEGVPVGVLAALLNALKLVGKDLKDARIVINGAGMAGLGTARLLTTAGATQVIVCDRAGAIYRYRPFQMSWPKWEIAKQTNPAQERGDLATIIKAADVFIGLSEGGVLTGEMVQSMARDPIIFAFAVPEPEIMPQAAREAGACVVATGRADLPNQADVASVFPGFFRGLLDVRAHTVNDVMLLAAAHALADLVPDDRLNPDYIIPKVLDFQVAPAVAAAVARAAIETGEARVPTDPDWIADRVHSYVYEGTWPVPTWTGGQMSLAEEAFELHRRYQGVLEIKSKIPIRDDYVLSMIYLAPGAVEPAREVREHPERVYDYTARGNLVAIVTDGSAVLGLGNIGARAALPVMEGKAVLFHTFGGVEAFPICVTTQDPDEIVEHVKRLEPTFGGVNLEDISAPRCFYIEGRLKKETDIPIFHDDQHGTAVVVLAGLLNALRLVGKEFKDVTIAVNGAGAAAIAVTRLLLSVGIGDLVLCDTKGTIFPGRKEGMNWIKEEMAEVTNKDRIRGTLPDAMKGRDVFIGLSAAGVVNPDMVRSMGRDPVVFALANPTPEIMPDLAHEAGAAVVATGRSDFDNQVNNSLAFPGIFRGALDVRARSINDAMKIAAAHAIASMVSDKDLKPNYIIPRGTDFRVAPQVAAAVARLAMETGEARITVDPEAVATNLLSFVYEGRLWKVEPGFSGR